jgi:murein tripeptide amidase MpaA
MRFLVFLIPGLAAAATVSTSFDGGSLGRVEKVTETHFRLGAKGEKDQDGRNRQANWYYFRVDQAGTKELTLDIVDLPGEYNYQPNRGAITKDTPPVISYDRRTWKHIDTFTYDPDEPKLTLRVTPQKPQFWIAHVPPYTTAELGALRAEARRNPDFHEEVIGKTVGGRDLVLWTIGAKTAAKDAPTVWLMFRQHSWETGSSWAGEGAVRALLHDDPEGRRLRQSIVWKIFPLCDPDGVARGGVRFNANGYDLNRNWDVSNSAKMPEIAAQREAVQAWIREGHTIALFFSLHNTETGEYLEGPPGGGEGKFNPLAERFFQILSTETTFAPTTPLRYAEVTTTAGMTGRMTVVQGLYHDLRIPAFLMEQRISMNPKLGHLPEIPDRLKFGGELVNAIAKTVLSAGK